MDIQRKNQKEMLQIKSTSSSALRTPLMGLLVDCTAEKNLSTPEDRCICRNLENQKARRGLKKQSEQSTQGL